MPNNTRTQADGTWIDGYTPPASDWEDLERKIFHSWNGDRGGAYAPPQGSSPVPYAINGSGLQLTGPTRLTHGGALRTSGGVWYVRDGTWPQIKVGHAGRTRSIVQSLDSVYSPKGYWWSRNHAYSGIGSVALSIRGTNEQFIERPEFYAPLRVVDGATLLSVKITFRVAKRRLKAPRLMPRMRVMRVPRDSVTNAPAPLKNTTDGLGFDFLPLVASPDAWYLEGAAQSFTYACDQNNVIDVENYSYLVHLAEEAGAISADDAFDGITLVERKANAQYSGLSTQALTGLGSGRRTLIRDPDSVLETGTTDANSTKNGIWHDGVDPWVRSEDLDDSGDFSPNWIVLVSNEFSPVLPETYSCWQGQYPTSTTRMSLGGGTADPTKTRIRIVPAEPQGNIYHSITPTFDVPDLRFQ